MKIDIKSPEIVRGLKNLTTGIWESEDWIFFISKGMIRRPPPDAEFIPHVIGWNKTRQEMDTPLFDYWKDKTFTKLEKSVTLSN